MFLVKKLKNGALLWGIILFAILIISNPRICISGALKGILLCGRVIIPSLFPFTMCVLFIMKSGILESLKILTPVTKRIFGLSGEHFSIFLLSLIGGYPVGARLIKEALDNGNLTAKEGGRMLNFSINAGPAFIIGAVGSGIINNKKIGLVLYFSHILSSIALCWVSGFFKTKTTISKNKSIRSISILDNFVVSTAEAASAILNICSFVILFSAINGYIETLSKGYPPLKNLMLFTEITNAVLYTDNIFVISFLLGFAGFCVWCQVISSAKNIAINYSLFLLFRLLHGILSMIFTKIFLQIFDITTPTFSSGTPFSFKSMYSGGALAISMFMMSLIFAISISTKKYTFKILEDII